jgi:EAL domain-containing protein (putative c-di-GMP-specific phosphodiesterase class I)
VELAGTLGLLTVAEGIETTQQSEHVATLGCDLAQGYLYSRPIEAEAVGALVSASLVSEAIVPRGPGAPRPRNPGELASA